MSKYDIFELKGIAMFLSEQNKDFVWDEKLDYSDVLTFYRLRGKILAEILRQVSAIQVPVSKEQTEMLRQVDGLQRVQPRQPLTIPVSQSP